MAWSVGLRVMGLGLRVSVVFRIYVDFSVVFRVNGLGCSSWSLGLRVYIRFMGVRDLMTEYRKYGLGMTTVWGELGVEVFVSRYNPITLNPKPHNRAVFKSSFPKPKALN